ncbi:hypothetical protein CHS0354_014519 [Potamilus streckersoni]|uniref:Uncharacterized protein n=1 Tax=Potamilus streckersoni TaxID=2493646 RepID=A0AAE0VRK0_9BIVA|nr:hypothetical protein CHS0354_014519 [Potamilus streckersoni]
MDNQDTQDTQNSQDSDSYIPYASQLERYILAEIKEKYDRFDKQSFKREISSSLDVISFRHICSSLHDIGRISFPSYPSGRLVDRTSRSDSAPGDGNTSEIKARMSRDGKSKPDRTDSLSCLNNVPKTGQSSAMDQSRSSASLDECRINCPDERVETIVP